MSTSHIVEWVIGISCAAAFSVGGVMSTLQGPTADLPWDKITGTGAAGLVLCAVWLFLKRDEKVRAEHGEQLKERDATIKGIANDFNATSTGITRTFAESTKAMDERAQQREARLAEMFQRLMETKS
jgi:hypothetical protein